MFERFSRSWALVKASAAVLNQDRELLVLPVVSGVCTILVTAAFLYPAYVTGMLEAAIEAADSGQDADDAMTVLGYVWMFAFYLVQYFVVIFFNTALVGAAMQRMDGGNPTLGSAIGIASSRVGTIFGYALISATVGVILRYIGERFGTIGRIVESMLGFGWSISTFLVVPIIVARGVGPVDAVKQSASLLRRSFGENIIGNAGIGLVFALLFMAAFLIGGGVSLAVFDATDSLLVTAVPIAATVVVIAGLIVFAAALGSVYSAAVYRYAEGLAPPPRMDPALLASSFRAKKA
ncbi:DUF6159 family protein [Microbaculum marinum]|uniref:DUF6159 family protein n=1 Tax=Microbaculum marinum TaxID=1764581 RepID=A0AAW9S481_9HYPH